MWSRKQQITGGLVLCFASLLLFSSRNHIAEHASRISTSYSTWRQNPAVVEDLPVPIPALPDTSIRETTLPGGTPATGFTIFDQLYVRNGTIYVVTSHPSQFPHLKNIISLPEDRVNWKKLDPTDREMQVISPDLAESTLGAHAVAVDGVSIIIYDTKQFMAHYYHWWGEIILGVVRVYSALALVPGVKMPLADISRFLLPLIPDQSWRDRAGVDGPLMRAAFPTASIERADHWQDLIALNQTFVFERAMIVSRTGAHQSPLASLWSKMISSTMNVTVPDRFWQPLRERLVKNTVGYLPTMDNAGAVLTSPISSAPIVTYVSRQKSGRRLTDKDHQGLIEALLELEAEGLIEFNIALMETLTFSKQIETVARSTIMVGVHGNGLTHQLWMPASPQSTVIEILYPGDYLHDYEMLSRNAGHIHYAVWNDTTLTYKLGEWFKGTHVGDGKKFHGSSIPVHGPTVTQIIRERLGMQNP